MLTAELLRARVRNGEVRPLYLDPGDRASLALAQDLVSLYESHVGKSRGELEEALAARVGEATDYVLHRGLAKLLADRTDFEVSAPCEPAALRRAVFEASARAHPVAGVPDRVHRVTRDEVLAEAASALGLTSAQAEAALYADLEDAHVVRAVKKTTAAWLVDRYNVALAQAVLLRATKMVVAIAPGDPQRYRQLFRFVKFYRLIHTVRGDRDQGYEITLDGPVSLFQLSQKYGVQLADFLPALLLCEGWRLRAEVLWGKEKRPLAFALDPGAGLRSHYPDKGVYVTSEEEWFVERFKDLGTPWRLERKPEIIDLGGQGVLIPDFVVRHSGSGKKAYLEIVGFWRRASLEARLALLKQHGPGNLVLAVSKRLKGSEDELREVPGEVVFFKDVILAKEVLERVERVAR